MKNHTKENRHGFMRVIPSDIFETTFKEKYEKMLIMKVTQKMILMLKMKNREGPHLLIMSNINEKEKGTITLSVLNILLNIPVIKFSLHTLFHVLTHRF